MKVKEKTKMTHTDKQQRLRDLPGVDHLLEIVKHDERFFGIPRKVVLESIRTILENIRQNILDNTLTEICNNKIIEQTIDAARERMKNRLVPVINATGVVLHTNLGRALLCEDALEKIGRAHV